MMEWSARMAWGSVLLRFPYVRRAFPVIKKLPLCSTNPAYMYVQGTPRMFKEPRMFNELPLHSMKSTRGLSPPGQSPKFTTFDDVTFHGSKGLALT